ncbi:MAG: FAD-dependent oxidoreductase [Gammaproteobacteria bacterium]|nr:FAD-dependent oxidoreductase [Gammaproteobacteria bacterium]
MNNAIEVVSVNADVLIIGGGLAGCMAAIKASESGQKVVIAEKANTLASGCAAAGIDHMYAHIPEIHDQMGYSVDDMIQDHTNELSRGFVNQDLLRLVISESYERMLNLESFGLNFRYEDSKLPGKYRVVSQLHSLPVSFNFDGRRIKVHLTKEAKRRGVKIYNRVSMMEILSTEDGHVTGALGVGTRDGKLYHFRAKAVVMSTGRVSRLTRSMSGVWGNTRLPASETGDGRAMAFRAGVPIINMEFLSPGRFSIGNYERNLGAPRNTTQPAAAIVDGENDVIVPRVQFYDWSKLGKEKVDLATATAEHVKANAATYRNFNQLMQEGRGPFYLDLTRGTEEEIKYIEWSISNEGGGALFLEYLKKQENFDFRKDKLEWLPNTREIAGTAASGLVVNKYLETNIKGLFAAGDEVGGMPWSSSPGAFTMGWRAGEMAAKEALEHKVLFDIRPEHTDARIKLLQRMTGSDRGHDWREAEIAIQNIVDHYANNFRSENMLQRGLQRLLELREDLDLRADSPHESGRCLEIRSLIENAEMLLRASIERKESRLAPFGFFRSDYPKENNAEYFSFLSQRKVENAVQFSKIGLAR